METNLDIEPLREHVDDVLKQAREQGATQAEASASLGAGLSVTVRMRAVETLEYSRDQGLSLTVYFGKRKGSASTSDLSDAAVAETVNKACSLARFGAADECAGLAEAARMATSSPDLDLWHPWSIEPAAAIELATECEAAALDSDRRITNSEGATVSSHSGARVYGNTHGFCNGYRTTQHSVSCAVLAQDAGQMERDFEYSVARHRDDLDAAPHIGQEAARRAVERLGARKLGTRQVPVLYPARLARSLFGHFLGAISGGALYRQASFLVDSVGQSIFAPLVSITEEPHIPRALASAPFDDEGVATAPRTLVANGELHGYVLGSYYARKLGLESTANSGGVHNIVVSDTGRSFGDLLADMDTGLLVTELMGQGVNPVTGDYSRGAAGFWVEGGTIQHPVSEITVAGNLKDMYQHIEAIGSDTELRGSVRTGSVLVSGMTVAGS